jgi:hypothetical protein
MQKKRRIFCSCTHPATGMPVSTSSESLEQAVLRQDADDISLGRMDGDGPTYEFRSNSSIDGDESLFFLIN